MSIGENIKKIRKEKKISQKKLSELVGVSKSSIEKYEADKVVPKMDTIGKISKVLEVSSSEILGYDFTDRLDRIIGKSKETLEFMYGTLRKLVSDAEVHKVEENAKEVEEIYQFYIQLIKSEYEEKIRNLENALKEKEEQNLKNKRDLENISNLITEMKENL